jgi:enoyl-CoA hydratase/carnithine racemase
MGLVVLEKPLDSVVRLVLNDTSKKNAMSEAMAEEFRGCVEIIRQDPSVKVVIVAGAGGTFSSGGDRNMLREKIHLSGEENRVRMRYFYQNFLSIRKLSMPLIASLSGPAMGAAFSLACACDLRIASDDARCGAPFAGLGLYPGMGSTFLFPRVFGRSRANELLLTGRIVTAPELLAWGFVSQIVTPSELEGATLALAKSIVEQSAETVRQIVHTMRDDFLVGLDAALEREAALQAVSYASKEFAERISLKR